MRLILFIFIVACTCGCHQKPVSSNLLPYPQEQIHFGDSIKLSQFLLVKADERFNKLANMFDPTIADLNKSLSLNKDEKHYPINLEFDEQHPHGSEAYTLDINKKGIKIIASSNRGCFYGIQSLKQLIKIKKGECLLPVVKITDYPNFKWRSYMLDEGRYFMGKDFVLGLLDELAALKINKFHWHLTDDAGWRIEIKKYPKLTEIGAFRDSTQINHQGKKWNSNVFDGKPHGGFYTQEDVKEIIAYADDRNIKIIPEIEMPGHSSAAIAAYPWLGLIGKMTKVPVKFGKLEDSYNITDPKVIQFLHDVLDEVCELFPSEVVHIGGDEVLFAAWKKSKAMQAHMKKHGLKTPSDAQIKFTNEISNYLASKGKRMMGWNEILGQNIHGFDNADDYKAETELSKQSVIHFWRGDVKLITEAAQKGYSVVNSTHGHTYLDYGYGGGTSLEGMYHWNPIPEGLEEKYHENIVGVGVQMWTEWAPTHQDVEYKTYPRIAAIAEVAWSGSHDYPLFLKRLQAYSKRWVDRNINFPSEEIK